MSKNKYLDENVPEGKEPNNNYTPGPWYFSPSVDMGSWHPIIATVKDSGQGEVYAGEVKPIAVFANKDTSLDVLYNLKEEDINLMTAAPDILEALIGARDFLNNIDSEMYETHYEFHPEDCEVCPTINKADRAIEKALKGQAGQKEEL